MAGFLAAGALALYAVTLAPTVLAGDGGEFQFVPYLLGVAHPTGYPLYTLLGWAWSHLLPVGDVAHRINLFSAFWAAAAVGLLYPATRLLQHQAIPDLPAGAGRLLATLAAATFAVTPTFWSQSIIAEVYGLHIFFVVLLLFLILRWGEAPGERGALLLGAALTFGLSLAHHRTTLLLLPGVVAYWWLAGRRDLPALQPGMRRHEGNSPSGRSSGASGKGQGRLLPWVVLAAILPLGLYLYIPWRAPATPYLHLPLAQGRELVLYDDSWPGFLNFVLGGPFGGSVDLSVDLGARLAMAWGFFRGEVGWLGLALAGVGLIGLAAARRWAILTLTWLAFLATVAFDLVYTIGDIYVLYIPAYLVVVLWIVVGVGTVARLGSRAFRLPSWAPAAAALPFFALPVWLATTHYAVLDQSANTRARTRWEAILAEPVPQDSILVSNDRNDMMPMWYFQYVGDGRPPARVRPDLLGLFPLITPEYPTIGHVLDLALGTGRPVYLIKEMPGIEIKVDVEAEGRLWHVTGPAAQGEPAHPLNLQLDGVLRLRGYDSLPANPTAGQFLQVALYWQALQPLAAQYHSFVHLVDAEGNTVAQSDHQPGGVYYPAPLWQDSEVLRDEFAIELPAGIPGGDYRLVAGMYSLSADGTLEPLGEPLSVGQVTIGR